MARIKESDYYQLCCDVINLIEDGYNKQEEKEAYKFAMKETKRLDKVAKKRGKKIRWCKAVDIKSGRSKKVRVFEKRHF